MSSPSAFHDLIARLQAGDQRAADQIFNRFTYQLIALARTRLGRMIQRKVDPEEVVQSAYKSFFLRFAEGQFEIASWNSLWGLLAVITVRKCGGQIEYFQAARRDVRQETAPAGSDAGSLAGWEAVAREPTPSEAAVLTETVEGMLAMLTGRNRDIVSLSLQGYKTSEISGQIGCSERTVQRILEKVRQWLETSHQAGD